MVLDSLPVSLLECLDNKLSLELVDVVEVNHEPSDDNSNRIPVAQDSNFQKYICHIRLVCYDT